jgi:hypothetical protein
LEHETLRLGETELGSDGGEPSALGGNDPQEQFPRFAGALERLHGAILFEEPDR